MAAGWLGQDTAPQPTTPPGNAAAPQRSLSSSTRPSGRTSKAVSAVAAPRGGAGEAGGRLGVDAAGMWCFDQHQALPSCRRHQVQLHQLPAPVGGVCQGATAHRPLVYGHRAPRVQGRPLPAPPAGNPLHRRQGPGRRHGQHSQGGMGLGWPPADDRAHACAHGSSSLLATCVAMQQSACPPRPTPPHPPNHQTLGHLRNVQRGVPDPSTFTKHPLILAVPVEAQKRRTEVR